MTAKIIKNRISEIASHFTFEYHGKPCGVDPFSKSEFNMWYGDNNMTANNIDDVMNYPFFDGESLSEICDNIEIVDY